MATEFKHRYQPRLLDSICASNQSKLRKTKKYKPLDANKCLVSQLDINESNYLKTDLSMHDLRKTRGYLAQKICQRNHFLVHKNLISGRKSPFYKSSSRNAPLMVTGSEKHMATRYAQITRTQTPTTSLRKTKPQATFVVTGQKQIHKNDFYPIQTSTASITPEPVREKQDTSLNSSSMPNINSQKQQRARSAKNLSPSFFEIEKRKRLQQIWSAQLAKTLPKDFRNIIGKMTGICPVLPAETFTYKYWIENGNNGSLIRQVICQRPGWVAAVDIEEANFIWTQWSDQEVFDRLQKFSDLSIEPLNPEPKELHSCLGIPKKHLESEYKRLGISLISDSRHYCPYTNLRTVESNKIVLYGKLQDNYHLSDKKHLLHSMQDYYQSTGQKIFSILPRTYSVTCIADPQFQLFEEYFSRKQNKILELSSESDVAQNVWILKPGENSNRGSGIEIYDKLQDIKLRLSSRQPGHKKHTYIIQKYITNPLLISGRKFDIRAFALVTSINGALQGYWYREGYLRTSSEMFSLDDLEEIEIHLTNDAVQKHGENYGRYEMGNKLSYSDFQKYLEKTHPKVNFQKQILRKIQQTITDTIKSVVTRIDPNRRLSGFEIFGYDFMIDENMNVWLIEVNTNPCLELTSSHLSRILPALIDNAMQIVLDPLFPEIYSRKSTIFKENKFELVYNENNN